MILLWIFISLNTQHKQLHAQHCNQRHDQMTDKTRPGGGLCRPDHPQTARPLYICVFSIHARWLSSKVEQGYKDESKAMMQIKDGDKEINIGWMTSGSDNDTV
jgi:hypothetical protein